MKFPSQAFFEDSKTITLTEQLPVTIIQQKMSILSSPVQPPPKKKQEAKLTLFQLVKISTTGENM